MHIEGQDKELGSNIAIALTSSRKLIALKIQELSLAYFIA
jgi:hypothetical protein